MEEEIPLTGGECTPGIVRIGNTVRRPLKEGWEFRHALLRHLEVGGFTMAPRLLGIDGQRREILSYLEGATRQDGPVSMTEIGAMIAAFHAVTAGTDLAAGREVVCHQDIAPWNTVYQTGRLVGLIDFDGVAPGDRLDDIAYAAWTFLDIGSSEAARVRTGLCDLQDGYGLPIMNGLSDAVLHQQRRVLGWRQHLADSAGDPCVRATSLERVSTIRRQMQWVEENSAVLDGAA